LSDFPGGNHVRLSGFSLLPIGLALFGLSQLAAQDFPKVIRIDRELIKEGKEAAHVKLETQYARVMSKTKSVPYLALTAETGPNEVWFVEGHDSYASIENIMELTGKQPLRSQLDALDTQDGDFKVNSRGMIAVLQPDLAVGTPKPGGWSKVRYLRIIVERYRVGPEWREMRAIEKAAREKMHTAAGAAVYRVTSGAPNGTVLIVIPMGSLKELDAPPGPMTFAEAMGAETNAKYRKLSSEVLIDDEEFLFSVNPKMSNPSKETIDGDPDFWAPKAVAPAKKKGAQ
jgi:hypothetical protein